jgi:LuxR family transcriptional regulator
MTDVLQLLNGIAEAPSLQTAWAQAARLFRDCGFSRVNYGFTRFRTGNSIGNPDDAVFLTTTDPAYATLYFRDGFFARTALYRWTMQNVGACTWRWVEEAFRAGALSPEEADAVRMNILMDVRAGITISFPEPSPRCKGGMGLIADPGLGHDDVDRIWAARGPEISAVAHMLHLKVAQLPAPCQRRALTQRQRAALEWVAEGKTSQDIATIMGLSVQTVEKHLRLAREALDVETTAQAVAKSTMLNLIFARPCPGAEPDPQEVGNP